MFQLETTSSVLSGSPNGWTTAQRDTFLSNIIDSTGTGSAQTFNTIWNYMQGADQAAAADSVRFVLGGITHTKIKIRLYDRDDASCPGSFPECQCFGWYEYPVTLYAATDCDGGAPSSPVNVATKGAWGHELGHLSDYVNRGGANPHSRNSEMLASISEHVAGQRWVEPPPNGVYFNNIFDVPMMFSSSYDAGIPYDHYRLFGSYLFKHYSAAADTGDLVYKWMRHRDGSNNIDTSFLGLAEEMNKSPYASQISGANAGEKLATVLHRFGIAKYLNNNTYASGIYGFGTDVSIGSFKMFEWPDTNYARARVLPPTLKLGSNLSDGLPDTLEKWVDPQQPWASNGLTNCCVNGKNYRPLRVATSGTDYLVFLADSTYFTNTGWDRDLNIKLRGVGPRPDSNQRFRIGYALFNSYGTPSQLSKSELIGKSLTSVTESVTITMSGDTLNTEFTIPRFGRHNKGAVVFLSMVENSPSANFHNAKKMDYKVIYEFKDTYWDGDQVLGTFGPQDSPIHALGSATYFVGQGNTLTLNSGTTVKFEKNTTTPRVLNVKGTMSANGVTFTSDAASPAKGDWGGIVVSNANGTVDMDNCTISYADVGIQLGTGPTGGSGGGGTLDGCNFSNNSDEDIWIDGHATVTVTGGVITTSSTSNHVGVHIDDAVGTTTIRGVEIIGTSTSGTVGILCEDDASLLGNHVHDFSSSTGAGVRCDLSDTTIVPTIDNYSSTVTQLMDNYKGIDVASAARPNIRRARIDDSTYGIYVGTNALPDVGTGSGDQGGCDITDSSNKHIACKTPRLSTLPNVKALYNWWGSSNSADFSSKISSFVDWNPFLGSDPYGSLSARIAVEEVPPGAPRVFQSAPNPFSEETTIRVSVPSGGTNLSLRIYDVNGRVVRELADQAADAGEHTFAWDGTDAEGQALPSGVYYYRAQIGAFEKTMKMLRVR